MKYLFLLLTLFTVVSCSKDDPEVENEEEVITTLQYALTATDGSGTVTFSFQDLDGDGGNNPTLTSPALAANTSYNGVITLLNEQESPAENITEEVEEEAEEHQFFFTSNVSGLNIAYGDMDADGNPIGLSTTLTTGASGSGTMTVVLRHEPDKNASGVSDGNISNAGGETDISVTFNVVIN